jgi:hypothetical protein
MNNSEYFPQIIVIPLSNFKKYLLTNLLFSIWIEIQQVIQQEVYPIKAQSIVNITNARMNINRKSGCNELQI